MKCVGYFDSARGGGTQSLCSLAASNDGASLASIAGHTGSPKQICERQMVAANERGEREGAMEGSLEGGEE